MRDVPEYVTRVLDSMPSPIRETADGWVCSCPSYSHGTDGTDEHPSLRLTIGKDGRILVSCRVGCTRESVLSAAGLSDRDLFCPPDQVPASPIAPDATSLPPESIYDPFWSEVYSGALSFILLDTKHRNDLIERGLPEDGLVERGYRSLRSPDRNLWAKQVVNRFGERAYTVPGFMRGSAGPVLHGNSFGLVVPVRNIDGAIVAFKIRRTLDTKGAKYVTLTSHPDGPSPGAPCHHPLGRPSSLTTLRITEGELKADIATHISGIYTIGVPGVTTWKTALPTVDALKPSRVIVSFDFKDVMEKPAVRNQAAALCRALPLRGVSEVLIETWSTASVDHKGIDDALHAGLEIKLASPAIIDVTPFDTPEEEPDPSTGHAEWQPTEFPLEVFPPMVADFITKVSESLQCPPDYTACASLVVAGRAIGISTEIVVSGDGGWKEMANLYLVVVAPPGSLKTAAIDSALRPIYDRQECLALRHEAKMKEWKAHFAEWREAIKTKPDTPLKPKPVLENIYDSNITIETLVRHLYDNQETDRFDSSILIACDEVRGWVNSLNQYRGGKGSDKEFFLQGWSRVTYKYSRKTNDENLTIRKPFVSVLGGIQPDKTHELQDGEGRADGFFDRLLFTKPRAGHVYRPRIDEAPPGTGSTKETSLKEAKDRWKSIINILLLGFQPITRIPPKLKETDPEPDPVYDRPQTVYFTPEAWTLWLDWQCRHADATEALSANSPLRGVYSKMRAQAARLLLIIHLLDIAANPARLDANALAGSDHEGKSLIPKINIIPSITEDVIRRLEKLVDYFIDHYKGTLLSIPFGPLDRRIDEFVEWARKKKKPIRASDVYKKNLFGTKSRSDAERLFGSAADRGHGTVTGGHTKGSAKYFTPGETID